MFRSNSDNDKDFVKRFEQASKDLKGDILFVVSDVKEGIQQRLAEFLGVEEGSLPTMTLLDPADNMKKFSFPHSIKDFTVEQIKSFLNDFRAKTL